MYKFFGGYSKEATPVPISNTAVKLFSADGTAGVARWESKTLPKLYIKKDLSHDRSFFYFKKLKNMIKFLSVI